MTREQEIDLIEKELGLRLPKSYAQFLIKKGKDIAFGLPILGLPAKYELSSTLGATTLLRTFKPELPNYLVIRIIDDRALCLDLSKVNNGDPALVEISLSTNDTPKFLGRSFQSYIDESEASKAEIKDGLDRLRNLILRNTNNGREYNHTDKTIPFKARHWRVHRCCVHDKVVGLTAFRYNESFNGIEVDTFLSTEHSDYEDGHGTKALIALILSDAYKNGTSMEIRFRQNRLPKKLFLLINSYGIKLQTKDSGILTHTDSVSLFCSLLGIESETKVKIAELEKTNEATLQGICFLINSRVWTAEEVNWLIQNVPRVKALLFGRDNPENRLNYMESLSFGRSALALSKFKEKIQISSEDELNEAEINIKGELFIIKTLKPCSIDWLPDNQQFHLDEGEIISVLSRPRNKWVNVVEQIKEDIKYIRSEAGKKFILYTKDVLSNSFFRDKQDSEIRKYFGLDDKESNIQLLLVPYSAEELDGEIIQKMKKSRKYRA